MEEDVQGTLQKNRLPHGFSDADMRHVIPPDGSQSGTVVLESDSSLAIQEIHQSVSSSDPNANILRASQGLLSREWSCSIRHIGR